MSLKLHNTLSGKIEDFEPYNPKEVRMYHCGPTVYGVQHIGNLSMFVFTDILRRTIEYAGFKPKQVINFTDFGHLSSDSDEGEDKMAMGLKREGLAPTLENMKEMGRKYAEIFLGDIKSLNVKTEGTIFPYASEYVPDQIELIRKLEEKSFAYRTSDGVYFDTLKFPEYGKLGGLSDTNNEARVVENSEKKNPRDFALWKFNKEIGWESPWGQGFPGWHIECSAMIIKILGENIAIHTGGVEHIPVHHNNEIAQSEAATGRAPFAKYWLHRAHLQIEGEKIAKSTGNTVYLEDIVKKGISPLAFRYLLLQSHYRTPTNFTWEALEGANNAYVKLRRHISTMPDGGEVNKDYKELFIKAIENDLNTPTAVAVIWTLLSDTLIPLQNSKATILDFDKILGLKLDQSTPTPQLIVDLFAKYKLARSNKEFDISDKLREEIKQNGYEVMDNVDGSSYLSGSFEL